MEIRFDGQVVLVTGASGGIGSALAKAFGSAGASVVVHYHKNDVDARAVATYLEAEGREELLVKADLTNAVQVQELVSQVMQRFNRIDVLVNNAGAMFQRLPLADTPDTLYDEIMTLNLGSVFRLCKHVVPIMQRQGRGSIINMSSVSARRGGGGGSVLYGASKAAVSTFTRGLAKELAADNIRVNAISPGIILTRLHDVSTPPERLQANIKTIPMGRAGTPEDCVGAVLFLASDVLSGYVTGQVIEINGGLIMP